MVNFYRQIYHTIMLFRYCIVLSNTSIRSMPLCFSMLWESELLYLACCCARHEYQLPATQNILQYFSSSSSSFGSNEFIFYRSHCAASSAIVSYRPQHNSLPKNIAPTILPYIRLNVHNIQIYCGLFSLPQLRICFKCKANH